jgi:hypothetical protein
MIGWLSLRLTKAAINQRFGSTTDWLPCRPMAKVCFLFSSSEFLSAAIKKVSIKRTIDFIIIPSDDFLLAGAVPQRAATNYPRLSA